MSVVEPFAPGHIETYRLDTEGRAFLEGEAIRYHRIGEEPAYTTFEVKLGKSRVISTIIFYTTVHLTGCVVGMVLLICILQPFQEYLFRLYQANR